MDRPGGPRGALLRRPALFSDHYWARLNALATGHLLGFTNSWGAVQRRERRLLRRRTRADAPFHFRDLAKSPEPELRQLAAELRLIEAINYFAPQETAQLIRPLLPLSKKEAANKKKGKRRPLLLPASASGASSRTHQDDEDESDLAGYMKRALAGDNRPPKVRPDQRWTTAPPMWTGRCSTDRNFLFSIIFVFAVFISSFAASSSTKVVPSAAAAADAVSSKEEPEPNISTEVFNELSSFVTYVEAMLADLDAKKGSKDSAVTSSAKSKSPKEVRNTGLLPGISAADQIGCAYRRWRLRQLLKEPEEPKEEKLDQKEIWERRMRMKNLKKILIPKNWMQMTTRRTRRKKIRRRRIWRRRRGGKGGRRRENEEEEEDEEEEEEEEKKAKSSTTTCLTLLRIDIWQKWPPSTNGCSCFRWNADPNQAEAEGQLNLWSAVFKVLKFADVTFSRVTAYMLKLIIRELCEALSTRREVFEEVATLLAKERAEEALLYELLAEIPQTQMELQTTKTKETKENEEEEWKLGVMTWRMCESSDGAIPKNNVVFTFRPYTAEEELTSLLIVGQYPPPPSHQPQQPPQEETAGIIRFLKGSYANHVLPVLTEAKEAWRWWMRTTARAHHCPRPTEQSVSNDLPRMLTEVVIMITLVILVILFTLTPPPKTVKITKLSEQDLQWRLNRVLAAAHTLREIALEVAWQAFSDEKAAAATAPEVFQQKQQDIFRPTTGA
ncbi:hypothetical protein TYRP_015942 [Tyrophagus putrescentiae]|nr:hypothetical protein TYRP_015942 [Tyrophagus putrescentiae]